MLLLLILVIIKCVHLLEPTFYTLDIEIFILTALLVVSLFFRINLYIAILIVLFCLGCILNPLLLLISLAFLHNLTPWGFLMLHHRASKAWMMFLINPLFVFLLAYFMAQDPAYILPQTALSYLSHYLLFPKLSSINIAFFAAAVYLQMIHYYFVIRVLPKLSIRPIKTNKYQILTFALIGIGFLLFFKLGKPIYGIFALFHAYLEIPILFYLIGSREFIVNSLSSPIYSERHL